MNNTLEVCVNEEIIISENVGDIMAFIEKVVQRVISGELITPINISIKLPKSNSPPALGINVNDRMKVGEALS
jgi:hypothetical protein